MIPSTTTPPALLYTGVFPSNWQSPIVRPIDESLRASQDSRSTEMLSADSEITAVVNSLVTFPPDLYRPNHERFDMQTFMGHQGLLTSQPEGNSGAIPRAKGMLEEMKSSTNLREVESGDPYAMDPYNQRANMFLNGPPLSGFVDRFPQPTLPVPLVPIFEYSDFYPKSSSPKAAINNPSESRSSDGWLYSTTGSTAVISSHMSESQDHNLQQFGAQATIDDQQSITSRNSMGWCEEPQLTNHHSAGQRGPAFGRVFAPPRTCPDPTFSSSGSDPQRPSSSSSATLVHRGPRYYVGQRRSAPYASSQPATRSPGPSTDDGGRSLSPYFLHSPFGGSLASTSTPALSVSPALSSQSPRQSQHTTARVMIPPLSERTFADTSRRPPLWHEPTTKLGDKGESHLHRVTPPHQLGVGVTSGQPPGNHNHPAVVPQLFISPSPSAPSLSIPKDVASFLNISFRDPQDWWRRLILDSILQSTFLYDDELEPLDKGTTDPITMGFGRPGRSIYGVFIEEFAKGKWKCLFGGETTPCPNNAVFKRFERAVEHVRSHLNHRPYKCDATCNPVIVTCQRKFFAHQYLRDHLTRKEKTPCIICGKSVLTQNISRHNHLRHSQSRT